MPRIVRIVVPGLSHHVTQRGNRREAIFFKDGDHEIYKDLLAEQTQKWKVEVWAYCLMPNHVHLILNPATEEGLGRAVGEAHRRYTNFINARGRWTGHLFQSRFSSVAMDEGHLMSAVRYVSLNPVRAKLVARADEWKWSSVQAHLEGTDDGLVKVEPVLKRAPRFMDLLAESPEKDYMELRRSESTGRPVGTEDFVKGLKAVAEQTDCASCARQKACQRCYRANEFIGLDQYVSCPRIIPEIRMLRRQLWVRRNR